MPSYPSPERPGCSMFEPTPANGLGSPRLRPSTACEGRGCRPIWTLFSRTIANGASSLPPAMARSPIPLGASWGRFCATAALSAAVTMSPWSSCKGLGFQISLMIPLSRTLTAGRHGGAPPAHNPATAGRFNASAPSQAETLSTSIRASIQSTFIFSGASRCVVVFNDQGRGQTRPRRVGRWPLFVSGCG